MQFSSVAQLGPTLCDPVDCGTPGFPVHHQLVELAQTHVHWVGDAIQPSHPLPSPSPLAFNLSQHRVFFSESVLCIRRPKCWSFSFSISTRESLPDAMLIPEIGTNCESVALNMPANLKDSAGATRLEKGSFHSSPKEGQCQRMFRLPHNCTHLTC